MHYWFWLIVVFLMIVLEGATASLVAIWFVGGGIAAFLTTWLGGGFWTQVAVFLVVSILLLLLTRPLVKKMMDGKTTPTNVDTLIGSVYRATTSITGEKGEVYADGKHWSARSVSGEVIAEGQSVVVSKIQGVTLYVEKVKETECV